MYMYLIPYHNEERGLSYSEIIVSPHEQSFQDVMNTFLTRRKHERNIQNSSIEILLSIAIETYGIGHIKVQSLLTTPMTLEVWPIQEDYQAYRHFRKMKTYIEEQSEIVLSTEIVYQGDVERDFISTSVNGEETFLFEFDTEEQKEEEVYEAESYLFQWGTSVLPDLNRITIEKPLQQEEEIINVFRRWADERGIFLEGKKIRLAQSSDFTSRPWHDEILDALQGDSRFSTPSDLLFLSQKEEKRMPLPLLVERLRQETPHTIACVLSDFKEEEVQDIVEQLKNGDEVIRLLPLVPCQSQEERFRWMMYFHYDLSYAEERMQTLEEKYGEQMVESLEKKVKRLGSEQDALAEYLAWKQYIEQKKHAGQ